MTKEELNRITEFMKENVWRNPNVMCMTDEDTTIQACADLIDIATSLHNLLYEVVTGKRYNYAFHWANKIGSVLEDNVLDGVIKEVPKNG